ncbi:hypothetical protein ACJ41O_000220 [Fusarium nematophilum]
MRVFTLHSRGLWLLLCQLILVDLITASSANYPSGKCSPKPNHQTSRIYSNSSFSQSGFSKACIDALSAPLNCSSLIADRDRLYIWGGFTKHEINGLCTEECSKSVERVRDQVEIACADDVYKSPLTKPTELIPGTNVKNNIHNLQAVAMNPVGLVDYYFYSFRQLCLKDEATSTFCYFLTGDGEKNKVDKCSTCRLGAQRLNLENERTYNKGREKAYWSSVSACSTTAPPLETPTGVFFEYKNDLIPTLQKSGSCRGEMMPILPGQTCTQFSQANNISTSHLLELNSLAGSCKSWPFGRTSLCVEGSCRTHVVKKAETCKRVAAVNRVKFSKFLSWNPAVDKGCVNWHRQIGQAVCVSAPNEYKASGERDEGMVGPLNPKTTAAAAVPENAHPESKRECGKWYTVQKGQTCGRLAVNFGITLQDLYFLNPSIDEGCSNLLAKSAYYVHPIGNICTYSGYTRTTATTTSTATSSTTATTTAATPTASS